MEFRLNPAGSAIRGRASTSQVTAAKCNFLFFSARVKLIPLTRKRKEASLEKKQGLAESQARFQPGDGQRKKCDSKMLVVHRQFSSSVHVLIKEKKWISLLHYLAPLAALP